MTSSSQSEFLQQIRGIDVYEFEQLIADIWEKQGWETTVTTGASDRGIDVIAEKTTPFSQKHLIQAKRYSEGNKVGSPEVQQYSSLRQQESEVDTVIIVTTSSFTSQARQTAHDLNVKLVDGNSLISLIMQVDAEELVQQYINHRKSVTELDPKDTKPDIQSLKEAAEDVNRGPDQIRSEHPSKSDQSVFNWIKKLFRM